MATIGTRLYTVFCGKSVGEDEFGNRYFTNKAGKRWVIYNGIDEASKVPGDWHRWLHKTTDIPPNQAPRKNLPWEKTHLPNLSGTKLAYVPKGHISKGGKRERATGDYEPWQPE